MLSRATLRTSRRALTCAQCSQRRGYAAASSGGQFAYQTSESAGTKLVSRNVTGPTSTLALVAKAGTRYQWLPGLSEALANFAFRNTEKRFAVRIVRESELLGSEIFSNRTREAVVFGARFLREDLPYFVELLGEVATETKYQRHIYSEDIVPLLSQAQKKFLADPEALAIDVAHNVAFHRGLGNATYPSSQLAVGHYLQAAEVEAYAAAAYSQPNIALVGSGVDQAELSKWTGEFFKNIPSAAPSGLPALSSPQSQYYGGESRIAHGKGNAVVIAFPGSSLPHGSAYKPEVEVLAALLGGQSSVKWGAGSSLLAKVGGGANVKTDVASYTDSGLLYVTVTGSAKAVAATVKEVTKTLQSVAQGQVAAEDVKRAIAQAKFKNFDRVSTLSSTIDLIGLNVISNGKIPSAEEALKGISAVSEAKVKEAAKSLLSGKVTVSTVGELQELPWAEELGLKV